MSLLTLLFAPKCPGCKQPLRAGEIFCGDCENALTPCGRLLSEGDITYLAAFYYTGVARGAMLTLKRAAPRELAAFFGNRLAKLYRAAHKNPPDLVVCVPMSGRRRRARGFNQAEILAKNTAGALGAPFARRALRQVRPVRTQHTLTHAQRAENVRHAYEADAKAVSGKRVLLIDDIITTGATVRECREALRAAGAAGVMIACAASAAPAARKSAARVGRERLS